LKIVFASTPGQVEKVEELAQYFYTNILPMYFSDEDIREFEKHEVLNTTKELNDNFSTLGEAFRVITSLQTIISILESGDFEDKYLDVFEKNAKTLRTYGIYFPFHYHQFIDALDKESDYISIYSKAANEYLV